ncbi:MAG TPA: ribonuclease H-like domain-containing protein [Candidatus Hydrothermia bacterium]|nr:ribonuclease H-like domain-containing protein [Candidatus Hydrothermae bacterium]MDD3648543.1 ribonuclease H-like domain-containing protein [Candidatus Hydrothermia bacterium]MDD5572716.1 ribonuclease H-like domain-containing protein [Candidatus Hydrothermia bacterium]HOK22597.1 ribonuclease H-like domain-containing protein [Candidatus Hydrothermia bacterium]HOL23304.1 ribonuclease H-like domain-containing protein [Candidatus Hydrothermia bacterium]
MNKRDELENLLKSLLEKSAADRSFKLENIEEGPGFLILQTFTESHYRGVTLPGELFLPDVKFDKEFWNTLVEINSPHFEKIVFLDLETRGLSRNEPIFIAGLLFPREDGSEVSQFVAKTAKKEKLLLQWVMEKIENYAVFTYNGKAFDIPFIKYRCEFHGLDYIDPKLHFDLLPYSRYIWKETFNSKALKVLECNVMDYNREFDVPSFIVPDIIKRYRTTGDKRYLEIVVRHNLYDLIATLKLLEKISFLLMNSFL